MTDADATAAGADDAIAADRATWGESPDADAVVTAHRSAPGRTVLTESGNSDAWIASSLTLDLSQ